MMKSNIEISSWNIRSLRELSKLTQKEFAELHGTNQKVQWTYEAGKSLPSAAYTLSLGKYYGFTPELLTTIKFKFSKEGKITNVPKIEDELDLIKEELNETIVEFEHYVTAFMGRINNIKSKIIDLERTQKPVNKKVNKKSVISNK